MDTFNGYDMIKAMSCCSSRSKQQKSERGVRENDEHQQNNNPLSSHAAARQSLLGDMDDGDDDEPEYSAARIAREDDAMSLKSTIGGRPGSKKRRRARSQARRGWTTYLCGIGTGGTIALSSDDDLGRDTSDDEEVLLDPGADDALSLNTELVVAATAIAPTPPSTVVETKTIKKKTSKANMQREELAPPATIGQLVQEEADLAAQEEAAIRKARRRARRRARELGLENASEFGADQASDYSEDDYTSAATLSQSSSLSRKKLRHKVSSNSVMLPYNIPLPASPYSEITFSTTLDAPPRKSEKRRKSHRSNTSNSTNASTYQQPPMVDEDIYSQHGYSTESAPPTEVSFNFSDPPYSPHHHLQYQTQPFFPSSQPTITDNTSTTNILQQYYADQQYLQDLYTDPTWQAAQSYFQQATSQGTIDPNVPFYDEANGMWWNSVTLGDGQLYWIPANTGQSQSMAEGGGVRDDVSTTSSSARHSSSNSGSRKSSVVKKRKSNKSLHSQATTVTPSPPPVPTIPMIEGGDQLNAESGMTSLDFLEALKRTKLSSLPTPLTQPASTTTKAANKEEGVNGLLKIGEELGSLTERLLEGKVKRDRWEGRNEVADVDDDGAVEVNGDITITDRD